MGPNPIRVTILCLSSLCDYFFWNKKDFLTYEYNMKNKINLKKIFVIIVFTILIGSFFSFFVSTDIYEEIVKPSLAPPGFIFPIAWIVLYILMSISLYLVTNDIKKDNINYYMIYIVQMIVNSFWTFIFFGLKAFFFSFLWILLLIVFVGIMSYMYCKRSKVSFALLVPYLLWLVFAAYLNFQIYLLN